MEADWCVEIGAGLPVIEADWQGYVDLRKDPASIGQIPEVAAEPALQKALIALNDAESPVLTTKCDVWPLDDDEIDPDEFGCTSHDAPAAGWASWIDVVARDPQLFASFEAHEGWVRTVTALLRNEPLPCGRVDLVVRAAVMGGFDGYGFTLYVAGCGADAHTAHATWVRILSAAVAATIRKSRASSSIG